MKRDEERVPNIALTPEIEARVNEFMHIITAAVEESNKFKAVDHISLEILRFQLTNWLLAQEAIKTEGVLVMGGNGQLAKNPAYDVSTTALKLSLSIMQDYGLTAMSRKKLTKGEPDPDEPESPLMTWFRENS